MLVVGNAFSRTKNLEKHYDLRKPTVYVIQKISTEKVLSSRLEPFLAKRFIQLDKNLSLRRRGAEEIIHHITSTAILSVLRGKDMLSVGVLQYVQKFTQVLKQHKMGSIPSSILALHYLDRYGYDRHEPSFGKNMCRAQSFFTFNYF